MAAATRMAIAVPTLPKQGFISTATGPASRGTGKPPALHSVAERLSFAIAPALFAACCFAAGTLTSGRWFSVPALLLPAIAAMALLAGIAALRATRMALMPIGVLFLLLGAFAAEVQPPVEQQRQLASLADGSERVVTGEVERLEPVHRASYTSFFGHKSREEQGQRVDLRLISTGSQAQVASGPVTPAGARAAVSSAIPLTGGLRLTLYAPLRGHLPALGCGSRLRVALAMHPEQRYLDPGVWDTSAYLHEQGIGALGSAAADKSVLLGTGQAGVACRLHMLQTRASSMVVAMAQLPIERRLPALLRLSDADASMLTAMLTGDRSYLHHETRLGFERTGSFHLLVVSGMHLAIFASVIFVIARRMRLPNLAVTAVTLALSFAYALFTGFGEPVQRSLWMVTLFMMGRLIFRERHALQALGLASLCLMAANPRALLGSSLQMTLLSVVAIAGIAAPLAERSFAPYLRATRSLWLTALDPSLPPKIAQYRDSMRLALEHLVPVTGRWAAREMFPWIARISLQALELLLLSVVVELAMALPMAVYFHRITVLSLPVNFLIVPFLGLLLPAALATFAVLLISPTLAVLPALVAAGLLHVVAGIVTFFSTMHAGDYRIPAPPASRVVLWILLLAAAVWLVRRFRWGPAAACAALLVASLLTIAPQAVQHRAGALEVTAIDVGQGDALLILTPDGHSLLVDAGGIAGAPADSSFNMGEDVVSPMLWSRGIQRLDAVAITHAHSDHIGGMPAILANFRPRAVWVGNNPLSPEYAALTADALALGIPMTHHYAGDTWMLGSAQVQALWPTAAYIPHPEPTNNDSLVLRLSYGGTSALLEGDAEALAEAGMLARGLGHADLLKVGHHGSRSSSTPPFLAAVTPAYAAISVGRRNFYGHPRHEVLDELQQARVRTYRTDMLGETTFYLDGRRVTAETWAESAAVR